MKTRILTAFIFSIFITSAYAADKAMEILPAPAATTQDSAFAFTVTGSGKLIPQAGATFTQGGNYEGKQLPYLVTTPQPVSYPRWAIRQGWEGRVSIAVEVKTDGSVGKMKVMQSSGHRILDEAASHAVSTWKFHPAMKNGQAIRDCVQIPVTFRLDEK